MAGLLCTRAHEVPLWCVLWWQGCCVRGRMRFASGVSVSIVTPLFWSPSSAAASSPTLSSGPPLPFCVCETHVCVCERDVCESESERETLSSQRGVGVGVRKGRGEQWRGERKS